MKADQLNEKFDKADWDENESHNLHTENAVELAHAFGTRDEVEAMERIADQHMRRGHILPHEIEERSALMKKYYNMLENETNPTVRSKMEGYKVMPPMDSKYVARKGLEGPFTTLSGKVVYYDPKEGKYYDPDTDIYLSYDEFQQYDNDYSGIGDEEADDFVKDIEPKETVKGPRGHLSSIVNAGKDIEDESFEVNPNAGHRDQMAHPENQMGTGPGIKTKPKLRPAQLGKKFPKIEPKLRPDNLGEAGGYYTQPVYDMIEQHGYEKVMHELLTSLDADVIQDFLQRAEFDESVSETLSPEEKKLVAKMYNKDGTLTDLGKKVMREGKYVSDAQRKAVHASKAEKK
tara:strand:+ start:3789 stop:4826 length:1038 start_codon:yes stop_codon:yes gene_type:complete